MTDSTTTRRRFLVAIIALSGISGGLRAGRSWAQGIGELDPDTRRALATAARRLFPHPSISDAVYTDVIDGALTQAAANGALVNAFAALEAMLDSAQPEAFADLDQSGQIQALAGIENTSYFGSVRDAVRIGVYNHPAVWELVGYGGPSWQQGGYLNRGAGEIDWLEDSD
jgi:hypothetical protein